MAHFYFKEKRATRTLSCIGFIVTQPLVESQGEGKNLTWQGKTGAGMAAVLGVNVNIQTLFA